jgi:Na+(H+)/acetate symporter ActP
MRQAMPILLFTTMITIAYSLFQGNVGTAYRQRAQILVFHFIFVSVGYVLLKEQQEDGKRLQSAARQALVEEASAKQEQRHSIRMARQTSEREPARVARGVNERLDT